MALRAVDARRRQAAARHATHAVLRPVRVVHPVREPPRDGAARIDGVGRLAPVAAIHPVSRAEALAAARRERRRWLAVGAIVFVTPFLACVGVLEVVR